MKPLKRLNVKNWLNVKNLTFARLHHTIAAFRQLHLRR